MGDPSIRWAIPRYWSKVKGLAFGAGFKANVLDAYRYLMEVYNDGDQIYIFGFSRGSYTARALAGLLHGYGLLCRGNEGHLLYAWRMMIDQLKRNRERLKKPRGQRGPGKANTIKRDDAFVQTFSRIVTIRFMGIWDTVSSVGWVYTPIRLLDGAQNPIIQVGRHAVSIDERRAFYRDNLWGDPVPITDPEWPATLRNHGIHQDIAQVWFPGAHSDVGGSYAQTEAAPANEALDWMIGELQQHGAQLCQDRIEIVLGRTANPVYRPPTSPGNRLHDSLDWRWWILQLIPQQYYDKDNETIQCRVPFGRPRSIPDGAYIHRSAKERLEHPQQVQKRYDPANLKGSILTRIDTPIPGTTANLVGSYILKTPNGKASVPSDPPTLRYAKLVFGWLFFASIWLVLAFVLNLLIGECLILARHSFDFLNQCFLNEYAWIQRLLRLLYR
jgi:Uncharacterized alpha/beta hydrolase domain (DUF2235)